RSREGRRPSRSAAAGPGTEAATNSRVARYPLLDDARLLGDVLLQTQDDAALGEAAHNRIVDPKLTLHVLHGGVAVGGRKRVDARAFQAVGVVVRQDAERRVARRAGDGRLPDPRELGWVEDPPGRRCQFAGEGIPNAQEHFTLAGSA